VVAKANKEQLATQIEVRGPGGAPVGNSNACKTTLYAVKTGTQLRTRRVRRLVARMYEGMPWLQESDKPAARAWAELEVIGAACFADMMQRGVANEQGEPRKLLGDWRLLKQAQLAYERELGMTPSSRATLRVDVLQGDDLATRALRMRRQNDDGS